MPREFILQPTKTYKTHANAVKAVSTAFSAHENLSFMVVGTPDGRFTPVFFGVEAVSMPGQIAYRGWTIVG